MNIKRTTTIATLATIAATTFAGFGAGSADAFPGASTQISNGKPKPVVVWDHAAWKKCYSLTYAQWREDGASPSTSQAAADLTCGKQP